MYKIIYPTNSGISIIEPNKELNIIDVAHKDVPSGVPYKVVNISDIPSDRTFRNAWEVDFSNPDGYGQGS